MNLNKFSKSLDSFSRKMYQQLVDINPSSNIICSPFSIQTSTGMLRMGVKDGCKTAKELDQGLSLSSSNASEIADSFSNVLTSYEECKALKMANKIYVMKDNETREEFNETLTQKFHSGAENIDFSNGIEAAETINAWVETRTNKLIKNLVSSDILNDDTRLLLINAIHFKGEWTAPFKERETRSEDFILENDKKIKVLMMSGTNNYHFADMADMEAKALRLAYRDINLFLLIILPNLNSGLKQLEEKLTTISLEDLTYRLAEEKVDVKLPKFKIEFQQELTPIFKLLGINRIFSNKAEFGKMLSSTDNLKVSKIIHKAYIEVNELGTEAAAATAVVVQLRSARIDPEPKLFHADHPFYFTIYDASHGCLFVGKFISPESTQNTDNIKVVCHCE